MYQVNIFICLFLFDLFCSSIYKYLREGDNRGWDDWMASLTQWTWVWVNSGSWWWTGRPGVLRFMGSQRVGHDWATELNWLTGILIHCFLCFEEQKSLHLGNSTQPCRVDIVPLVLFQDSVPYSLSVLLSHLYSSHQNTNSINQLLKNPSLRSNTSIGSAPFLSP